MSALLSVRGLAAGYGDSVVIRDMSFDLKAGEVVCLLGANGAGKTTTMAVLSGLIKAMAGQIVFDGRDLLKMQPHERVAAGMSLCPEGREVFPNLTVEENLLLGSFHAAARMTRRSKFAEVYELFPILAERRKQRAGLMSGGEQQMLALGRALMANPRLLLLDEPSLGLAPRIVLRVFEAIQVIARSNISILLVEQRVAEALHFADRGYVLSVGQIVHEDTAEGLRGSAEMQAAFMGRNNVPERSASHNA